MMSTVKTRQLPKLTAIPRPIQVIHKPRQYSQLKTLKPKANWSGYNVLPAIQTNDFDDFIKNENDLYDEEPTPYNEISDSEFLFDQMTAELDEMIERETKIKMIREKAFTQYLELKSDYLDWVIKMAHNNVWVSVKDSGMTGRVSIDQSSVRGGLEINVPSPPDCPKGPSPSRDNPEALDPKSPSYPVQLPTVNILSMPPVYSKDERPTSLRAMDTLPKPPTYPNEQSTTSLSTDNSEPKQHVKPNDDTSSCKNTEKTVSQPFFCPTDKVSTSLGVVDVVPKRLGNPKDKSPTRLTANDSVSQPSAHHKKLSSTKHQFPGRVSPDIYVPRPPAYPKNKYRTRRSPEVSLFVPTPPVGSRDKNRNYRKVSKPDIVPELRIPSSNRSPIQELLSSRID